MVWEVAALVVAAPATGRLLREVARGAARALGRSRAEADRAMASGGLSLVTEPTHPAPEDATGGPADREPPLVRR